LAKKNSKKKEDKSFEDKLWDAAENMRGPLEYPQYKYVVLPLLFLKFSSDLYQKRRDYLEKETKNPDNKEYFMKTEQARDSVINDPDEYHKESVLFIKKGNSWNDLMKTASQENIAIKIDKMLNDLEMDNPVLQGVLQKNFSALDIPNDNLSTLINDFSTITHGETRTVDFDFLGRMYEFFLGKFSSKEGKGEFYTPYSIVKLIAEILEPEEGKVFDPTCGSGGMLVQCMQFHNTHKNSNSNLAFYAQEFTKGIWQICKMNLILRGIDTSNVKQGDSLVNDKHQNLKADYIMANPPFNELEWGYDKLKNDKRWKYGLPSYSKAGGNFAFMQHMIHHLDEKNGKLGLVLANGSMSDASKDEGMIRQKIVEDDLVDCMIALPKQLFFTVRIPVCIWVISKNKDDGKSRKRKGETLFINAEKIFTPIIENGKVDRAHNKLSEEQIQGIISTYRSYTGQKGYPKYNDILGYCKVLKIEDIAKSKFILTPGRHAGAKEVDDDELFTEKMGRLTQEYTRLLEESSKLDKEIRKNLKGIGFEV